MNTITKTLIATLALTAIVSVVNAALPNPGMKIEKGRTAVVITDPQNDFLSPKGVTWGVLARASRPITPWRTSKSCLSRPRPTTSRYLFHRIITTHTIMAGGSRAHSKN